MTNNLTDPLYDWFRKVGTAMSDDDYETGIRLLAESRARFADSEARRTELESVIAKAHAALMTQEYDDDEAISRALEWLSAAPSVVLEDRDREIAARALEDAASDWHEPYIFETYSASDWLSARAAAIRKGEA